MYRFLVYALVLGTAIGCKTRAPEATSNPAGDSVGIRAAADAFLAYEHEVGFHLPQAAQQARIDAARTACSEERYGPCSVLELTSGIGHGASAMLKLRAAPNAIDPLIALAGEGARLVRRQTRAEDLAEQVAQTAEQSAATAAELAQLREFVTRKDLSAADLIALSQRIAQLEAQARSLAQDAAQQRRRIETNLLTLHWHDPRHRSDDRSWSDAWNNLTDSFRSGVDDALGYLGYFIPLLVIAFPMALLWRWAWRRATGRREHDAPR